MKMRIIEVFAAAFPLRDDIVDLVESLLLPGCDVQVWV
jgi:hypothetical protein